MAGSPTIVTFDHQRYHIQKTNIGLSASLLRKIQKFDSEFVPTTAISWNQQIFDDQDLASFRCRYQVEDDVWTPRFLALVILLLPNGVKSEVRSKNTISINNSQAQLPDGPLVIQRTTGQIFRVCKLVKDTHHAFISAIVPEIKLKSGFREFHGQDELEIALPSRLYFRTTDSQPFAGLRVAVKDTIAMKGLRTGYGSRAWLETYGPEDRTAPCVQMLLDAGAIMIGKCKSSEFAEGVDPIDWEEGVCPINPRGDGRQKPSSSSTGSASAAAAYDWLDISIGTDTGGSIRHPAGVQGLFGQRPTHGRIDLTGVLGATNLFNTVGIFARSSELFTKVGSYLVDPSANLKTKPERRKYNLLYPTRAPEAEGCDAHRQGQHRWFSHPQTDPSSWTEADKQIEAVISRMESEFDCRRVPFILDELWRATHPIGQPRSIDEATGTIYGVITTSSACETGIDQFIKDFAASNEGKMPPISDKVKRRFEYGRQCTNEQIANALKAMEAFSKWVINDLFGSLDQDATTILIFPQSCGRPDFCDATPEPQGLFKEFFSIYSFAYLCGCPDYTIPIGEVPFQSPVSNQTEYLPVSLSLVGRPGTDLELFNIIDYLHQKGIVSDVAAGRRMYCDSPLLQKELEQDGERWNIQHDKLGCVRTKVATT